MFDLAAMISIMITIDQVTDTRAKREPFTDTMIDAERFQSFRTPKSAAWHERQHEVGQGFLNRFMRQVRDPIHDDFSVTVTSRLLMMKVERCRDWRDTMQRALLCNQIVTGGKSHLPRVVHATDG